MLLKNRLDNIQTVLKSNNVLTKLEERYCYAKDASNLIDTYKIPELVVFVETIEEIQTIVKYANLHNIPIIPRGAGTNMVGACVCNKGGIVLNFSKMNKILEINPTNMVAKVQPGVVLGNLKKEVENFDLFYPPDPSNYRVSTIGGSIAQSSGGALSFKYGTTKDYVLSLKVITANGDLVTLGAETTKDSAGYHLAQLMIGSEGTLGIIVEATLKLIPKPEKRCGLLAYFSDINDAVKAVNSIIAESVFPASIDYMNKNSISTVEDFVHCGLKTDKDCLLLIELDGYKESLMTQIEKTKNALYESNVAELEVLDNEEKLELTLRARRSSYAAVTRLAPDVISDDIIVPRNNLAKMIKKCENLAKTYSLNLCLVGHIGDGNLHPQFAIDINDEKEFRNYKKVKDEIYNYVKILGGTISAEHGIGLEKKAYLENTIDRKALEYMRLIKKIFDPNNILNPDKIFEKI